MDLISILRIAMRALARNKMRSILTMLGIIIGVGAVIAMVGLGQGAQEEMQKQIAARGASTLFIGSGTVSRGGLRMGWGQTKSLVREDMEAILREVPTVRRAAPGVSSSGQVVYEKENWSTRMTGTEPAFFEIRSWPVQMGSLFSPADVDLAANVAVIGETVRRNLFGPIDPIGQTIRIRNLPFQVVGVLEPRGGTAGGTDDQDDHIYMPITTMQRKITGEPWLRYIHVEAISREDTHHAQRSIEALLRDRHRIRPGMDDDFFVRNMAEMADLADEAGRVMTLLLASIASVSLLVGGIGIMNIMLVSVTERTREIGIRMAIGATESDVKRQFLVEAVVLSLIGGAIGILFGIGSSFMITNLLQWPVLISPLAIGVAVLFSMTIGVFFGYYPASKAARLDPIEALRYE